MDQHPCMVRGFLPLEDPYLRLPEAFEPWEELSRELPGLLVACRVREQIERLPLLDPQRLEDRYLDRAMLLLSFLGHAAVWEKGRQQARLSFPRNIAVPWAQVAKRLGRPPVLSYNSHVLGNWRRIDPQGPIVLENLAVLQTFFGGLDEAWFILVHVALEGQAAPIAKAAVAAQEAVAQDRPEQLLSQLLLISEAQREVERVLMRMTERCEPFIYFHRIQPFLHGFLQSPVVYEGVEEFGGQGQTFAGGTAAQSPLLPLLDGVLGVQHMQDLLLQYLVDMRRYMPPVHRNFLESVEQGPSVRNYLQAHRSQELVNAYNTCIALVHNFRQKHVEMTARYILSQARENTSGHVELGTGGTPFTTYLKKHRDETLQSLLT